MRMIKAKVKGNQEELDYLSKEFIQLRRRFKRKFDVNLAQDITFINIKTGSMKKRHSRSIKYKTAKKMLFKFNVAIRRLYFNYFVKRRTSFKKIPHKESSQSAGVEKLAKTLEFMS